MRRLQHAADRMLGRLFREVTRAFWTKLGSDATEFRTAARSRLAALERKKERLVEVYVYQQAIDEETFRSSLDKLNQDIILAKAQLAEIGTDDIDVEPLLEFGEHVATHAGMLWEAASLDQRQSLQRLIFPAGLTYSQEGFRTAPTCILFNSLHGSKGTGTAMVSPTGFEPVLSP